MKTSIAPCPRRTDSHSKLASLQRPWAVVALLLGSLHAQVFAATLTVPTDHGTIQGALTAASLGDTMFVLPGTYTGPGNRDLTFGGKSLVVLGSGPELTIIDCQGSPAEPHRGFDFNSGEGPSAVLAGFTIRNGYSPSWSGGINCRGAKPTIRDCVVENCRAEVFGGGMGIWSAADPAVEGCAFVDNVSALDGGGIGVSGARVAFSACEIRGNEASRWGGGLSLVDGTVLVGATTIAQNHSASSGGGIYVRSDTLQLVSSSVVGNSAAVTGGGISANTAVTFISETLITGNVAPKGGGIRWTSNSTGELQSCTIAGNRASADGGGIYVETATFLSRPRSSTPTARSSVGTSS